MSAFYRKFSGPGWAGTVSFLFSFVVAANALRSMDGGWPSLVGLAAQCLVLGLLLGAVFGAGARRSIGIGALGAGLLVWLPVVVVTYGFALIFVPCIIVFAACVVAGTWLAALRI